MQKTFQASQKNVDELELNMEVEYIDDIVKIAEMDIMEIPALAVNGKVVLKGGDHKYKEIKDALNDGLNK